MASQAQVENDSLDWLLGPDSPGVRYLALRDLLKAPEDDAELRAARVAAHREGPIAVVLQEMHEDGYWVKPGPGYGPKYRSTVWAMTLLAQMGGAISEDARIGRACAYVLDHALAPGGQFSYSGAPSGTFDCLQGNLCWALTELGCDDPRLGPAFEWMARSVTGEGVAPMEDRGAPVRYYAYKCGPLFACGPNNKLACAWGGVKVMQALGRWPLQRRTPQIEQAIRQGVDFFFSTDPALADYPSGWNEKPSGNWWKFGFPVFYVTDLLQLVESLVRLGYGADPRLANALELIRRKQDAQGRWPLEYNYGSKTWGNYGRKGQPNKWVTLRALRVLRAVA